MMKNCVNWPKMNCHNWKRERKTGSQYSPMLIPKDPQDEKNAILEIRAGTGGDEASLFAGDLLRMYLRIAKAEAGKLQY